ncbi:SDR family NAD(P)-dependent oxidoreductase [Bacillus suaedae]|uniref:SDR family oxidoreductase n=1 Tax=Halalkalibacter suaedae TaxID=2822140 RepID=A0A940WRI2_9BACI|nr:SDR family oxidoreductase [Bacillus suaedae]MBP3951170.1 SDR family oxidoreductase [Bacillus suaedae]
MKGKTIWITGASGGLGRDLALLAAEQEATVVLLGRDINKLKLVQDEIHGLGGNAFSYQLNIGNSNDICEITERIFLEIGNVDVLINNAGFGIFDKVEVAKMEEIKEMFAVNVIGLIALTQAVLPTMYKRNQGHIINIASQAGKLATPKSSVYSATKHAVLGFTNSLRMEVANTNINISAVNPGPIRTAFFEQADKEGTYVKNVDKWMLESKEVAKATIQLINKPKRELNLPRWMGIGTSIYHLMPGVFERIAGNKLNQK